MLNFGLKIQSLLELQCHVYLFNFNAHPSIHYNETVGLYCEQQCLV